MPYVICHIMSHNAHHVVIMLCLMSCLALHLTSHPMRCLLRFIKSCIMSYLTSYLTSYLISYFILLEPGIFRSTTSHTLPPLSLRSQVLMSRTYVRVQASLDLCFQVACYMSLLYYRHIPWCHFSVVIVARHGFLRLWINRKSSLMCRFSLSWYFRRNQSDI